MLQIAPVWDVACKNQMIEWKREGLTSTQIAERFNQRGFSFSRNAIIGKLFRHPEHNPDGPPIRVRRTPAPPKPRPRRPKILPSIVSMPVWVEPAEVVESIPVEVNDMTPHNACQRPQVFKPSMLPPTPDVFTDAAEAIASLGKHQCHYPNGHVESGFAFCTGTRMEDSSYCKGHHRLTHRYVVVS